MHPSDVLVVILCGGEGTRLREETTARPKPLIDIGTEPILMHIMRLYSAHGFRHLCRARARPALVNFGPADPVPLTVHGLVEHFMAAWGPSRTRVLTEPDPCAV